MHKIQTDKSTVPRRPLAEKAADPFKLQGARALVFQATGDSRRSVAGKPLAGFSLPPSRVGARDTSLVRGRLWPGEYRSYYQQSLRHGCAVPPPFTQGRH